MTKRSELPDTISFTFPVGCDVTYHSDCPTVVNYPTGAILGLIEEIMGAAGIGYLKMSRYEEIVLDEYDEGWYDSLDGEEEVA